MCSLLFRPVINIDICLLFNILTRIMYLKNLYLHHRKGGLSSALENKAQTFYCNGQINSYYRVRSTQRALEEYAGDRISFEELTPDWLAGVENHWRCNGMRFTSINIYMKTLKSVVGDCVRCGMIPKEKYPFGRGLYEIPCASSRKLAMTKEQIAKIVDYSGDTTVEKYRDLWLFSYLCNGINFRDMLFLRFANIENDEITFVRSKTRHAKGEGQVIRAAITPLMREIISKWGNAPGGDRNTFIFKYAKEGMTPIEITNVVREVTTLCNRNLRKLSVWLGLPHFTTYSARHSFATVLQRSGVNVSYISECLGHSSLSVTETYLAGFERKDRIKYSKYLTKV